MVSAALGSFSAALTDAAYKAGAATGVNAVATKVKSYVSSAPTEEPLRKIPPVHPWIAVERLGELFDRSKEDLRLHIDKNDITLLARAAAASNERARYDLRALRTYVSEALTHYPANLPEHRDAYERAAMGLSALHANYRLKETETQFGFTGDVIKDMIRDIRWAIDGVENTKQLCARGLKTYSEGTWEVLEGFTALIQQSLQAKMKESKAKSGAEGLNKTQHASASKQSAASAAVAVDEELIASPSASQAAANELSGKNKNPKEKLRDPKPSLTASLKALSPEILKDPLITKFIQFIENQEAQAQARDKEFGLLMSNAASTEKEQDIQKKRRLIIQKNEIETLNKIRSAARAKFEANQPQIPGAGVVAALNKADSEADVKSANAAQPANYTVVKLEGSFLKQLHDQLDVYVGSYRQVQQDEIDRLNQ